MNKEQDSDASKSGQVKTYAFYTWMIIPATLFLPWIEAKPSDSGGSAIGLMLIGFLVFIVFSFFLAKKVYMHRLRLDNSTQILGYSPFVRASFLLIVFTISLID